MRLAERQKNSSMKENRDQKHIRSPEHDKGDLIMIKGTAGHWGKDGLFIKRCWVNEISVGGKSFSTPNTQNKNHSRQTADPNGKRNNKWFGRKYRTNR